MNPKLSVVVPCYNVLNLLENVSKIIREVSGITEDYEIILVDDGNEKFIYITQSEYVKVITHNVNLGKGEALISGFKAARGEVVAFLDADLQIPASTLKSYYNIMISSRSPDILIGSKRHINSKVDYPFTRRLFSFVYQSINKILFGLDVLDTQVGVKMFKKDIIKDILPYLSVKKFAIDLEILFIAQKRNYKILEAPAIIEEEFSSTINFKAVRRMIQDTIGIWLRGKFKKYERR